ncbi:hypothetical protein KTC96_12835 [Clostridium estertheticum]|uniref:SNF2-related protein n=1 Tax=Clostridium estertheticum TaxID=238834 RepID=UPI001C7D16E9|nr:SNF2-related protein [Clostridium estertheticum]MBX4259214.1 hypothetical protein [Clostridium estertheticum]WLC72638.1 hypothetical protein KTC96_12835 [Clostridium estertheticum]
MTLLKPGQLKTYTYFKNNFIGDKEGIEAKNVDRLRSLLSGVMIRNKRSDVEIKFTKRTAITYSVNLVKEEVQLYDDISMFIREKYISEHNSVLTRFMLKNLQEQMESSIYAAIPTLKKYAEDERLTSDEKSIFSEFSNMAEIHSIKANIGPQGCNKKIYSRILQLKLEKCVFHIENRFMLRMKVHFKIKSINMEIKELI